MVSWTWGCHRSGFSSLDIKWTTWWMCIDFVITQWYKINTHIKRYQCTTCKKASYCYDMSRYGHYICICTKYLESAFDHKAVIDCAALINGLTGLSATTAADLWSGWICVWIYLTWSDWTLHFFDVSRLKISFITLNEITCNSVAGQVWVTQYSNTTALVFYLL